MGYLTIAGASTVSAPLLVGVAAIAGVLAIAVIAWIATLDYETIAEDLILDGFISDGKAIKAVLGGTSIAVVFLDYFQDGGKIPGVHERVANYFGNYLANIDQQSAS